MVTKITWIKLRGLNKQKVSQVYKTSAKRRKRQIGLQMNQIDQDHDECMNQVDEEYNECKKSMQYDFYNMVTKITWIKYAEGEPDRQNRCRAEKKADTGESSRSRPL